MLDAIVSGALRFKGIVLLCAAAMLGYGTFLSFKATLDVFPDFVPPQVTIQTEAPGLSPDEVEALVTFPIEAAVGGIPGLEETRSESIQGLSVVDLTFADGTNELTNRQLLSERLTELAGTLPSQARVPTTSPMVSSTMDLLKIGLVSDKLTPTELRTLADWTVRPILKSVPGVAEVTVVGGGVEEIQLIPRMERMAALGVGLADLSAAAAEAVGVRGAGYVETVNQRLTIHAGGPRDDLMQIGRTIVKGSGGDAIHLDDVAEIRLGTMPKFGDALINGKPGVMLALTSQSGANTLGTTHDVETALQEILPVLTAKGVVIEGGLHRPANFIEVALKHLSHSLWLGGALVGLVLLLFLADLKTAFISFISFISIPLSLLSAVVVMHFAGITLNTMTLGGLAVAVGVVVDDAIIDVENILRRLRENHALSVPQKVSLVVRTASIEVRGAVIYATLIVIAVFLPVFALSGLQGRFFQPLAISFILAVTSSLVVAMTVTPALCLVMLGRTKASREPFYVRWMVAMHGLLLRPVCRVPVLAVTLALIAVAAAGLLGRRLATELLPPFREGHFVLQAFGAPGSSLEETMRFGKQVSDRLLAMPEIDTVELQAGRSERGVDTWGPERCEFHVELKHDREFDEEKVQEDIRAILEGYANMQTETLTFLGDRISESLSGETAAVVVSVFGKDLDSLETPAAEVGRILGETPGATDVQSRGSDRAPGIEIRLDTERLQQLGLRPVVVLDAIQTAFQGTEAAQVYDGDRVISVNVRLAEETRADVAAVGRLQLATPAGGTIALSELATVYLSEQRASIRHETGRRRQVVTANVSGRGVADFVREAKSRIEKANIFPDGVYAIFTGAAQAEATAHLELAVATGVTLVVIGMFLSMVFRRATHFLLVVSILPCAVAGGVCAIALSGMALSLGALIGFITLLGLSVRNAIMLMTHYEHLVNEEGCQWGLETVIRGARERVIPVLMTTAVTGLALLPLALAPTTAGREVEGPMAIVILGGLISSTLVTLLVLPAATMRFGKFQDLDRANPDLTPSI